MKRVKRNKDGLLGWLHRYINGTKGVISLFLAILMVPFVTVAGALVNAARINSAVAIFDEALCNASNSTLGTYDEFLRSRFGLLAISQDSPGNKYTVDEFINETFEFYMEQNCLSLSNTYFDVAVDAAGIYPLADTDVLMSQVLENGKYTVPLKLVVDGFNLDSILKSLTGNMSLFTNALGLVSSATDTITAYDKLNDKMDSLKTTIESSKTAYTAYETAFNNFSSSVSAYNTLVDERAAAIDQCQRAINTAQTTLQTRQSEFNSIAEKHASIIQRLEELKNEKDSEGNPVDNSEEIASLEEEYKEELKEYREAETALQKAKRDLTTANNNLTATKNYYDGLLSSQRTIVSNRRSEYASKISELMTAVQSLNTSISDAQGAASSVISKGASTLTGAANVGVEIWKTVADNDIEDLKAQRAAADAEGNTEIVAEYDEQIREAQKKYDDDTTKVGDVSKVLTSGQDESNAVANLETFAEADYQTGLAQIYSELQKRETNTLQFAISSGASKMGSVSDLFYKFDFPISVAYVEQLLDGLLQDAMGSAFITVIKAIVGFITAIFEMLTELGYDHDLVSDIESSKYNHIGGLPSTRSQDSYRSEYLAADSEKSENNKAIIGAFSGNGSSDGSVSVREMAISNIMEDIRIISETVDKDDWGVWTFIGYLKTIVNAISDIISQMLTLVKDLLGSWGTTLENVGDALLGALDAIYSKMLLVGYLGYNTSNRTTHEKSALTGASFSESLPSTQHQNAGGYAFYGAETEYIVYGNLSEIENQRSAFYSMWGLRLIYDLFIVWGNAEIQAVAAAVGAATLGILYVPVLILWGVLEALIDTIILCHGGGIPYVKLIPYLSVAGIPDLIKSITGLALTSGAKDKLVDSSAKAMNGIVNKVDDPEKRAEINSKYYTAYAKEKENLANKTLDVAQVFEFDYSKVLMLYMLFFGNSEKMLLRFSDIVQMEAAWHEVNTKLTTTFDLGKSYTYLRASGKFGSNQFIRITDGDLASEERIVYRGY